MYIGSYGEYKWIVTLNFNFNDLLKKCPNVLLSKYLVITSFDSGPLIPNQEEIENGWTIYENTMCSPVLDSLENLPYDNYDEWYVFKKPNEFVNTKTFVNYSGFTLRNPSYLLENADITWDKKAILEDIEIIENLHQEFWNQIQKLSPESYIANGDNFIYVTNNNLLYNMVKTLVQEMEIRSAQK
jgi:hypothetical protein